MDSRDFFQDVAARNYYEFFQRHDDKRLLWNAVVSMNSVAEWLALDRLGYPPISRKDLELEAQKIREQYSLSDLKVCAETFKHVRKIKDQRGGAVFTSIASSTGVTSDKATWTINGLDVVDVLQKAFANLDRMPQLR
jgi:hypothetical protein